MALAKCDGLCEMQHLWHRTSVMDCDTSADMKLDRCDRMCDVKADVTVDKCDVMRYGQV